MHIQPFSVCLVCVLLFSLGCQRQPSQDIGESPPAALRPVAANYLMLSPNTPRQEQTEDTTAEVERDFTGDTPTEEEPLGHDASTRTDESFADQKSYRQANSYDPKPAIQSSNSYVDRMFAAMAEGQERDHQRRTQLRIAKEMQREELLSDTPLDAPKATVTRFDFGLGMVTPYVNVPVPQTGRRRTINDELRRREAQLVGQIIPVQNARRRRTLPGSYRGNVCRPRTANEYAIEPSCGDGVDNNSNGVADYDDPACWADGQNQSTYSRDLDEGLVVSPVTYPFGLRQSNLGFTTPVSSGGTTWISSTPQRNPVSSGLGN